MKKLINILSLAIVLVSVEPQQWDVSWTPHPDNKGIRIVYRCEVGTPFFAYNWFSVEPNESHTRVHRVEIPAGSSSCWAGAEIIRNAGDDPAEDYAGEYTVARME